MGHTKQKAPKSGSFKKSKTEEQSQTSDEDFTDEESIV